MLDLDDLVRELKALAIALQRPLELDEVLQLTVETAACLLGTERCSVRLLEEDGQRLLTTARAGTNARDPELGWRLGEGLLGWVAQTCASLRTGRAPDDPRFAPRVGPSFQIQSFVGVPILRGAICIGVLSAADLRADVFDDRDQALLELLGAICAPHLEVARLQRLSSADPLTGLLNRRGLDELFDDPSKGPLTIAMADLDHFKEVNDRHGHAVGDLVLQAVARRLCAAVRQTDAVARVGGEEFLMVLPGVDAEGAWNICERARRAIGESPIDAAGTPVSITISVGIAQHVEGESRAELLKRADDLLYAAKRAGRDRVLTARSADARRGRPRPGPDVFDISDLESR